MIKKLHFIWINRKGKPIPPQCLGFIREWQKLYPDFDLKVWVNEDIAGLGDSVLTDAWAHSDRDEAALVDRMRLLVVNRHGGIYADIDTKPIRNMSELITDKILVGESGMRSQRGKREIVLNLFYSPPNHEALTWATDNFPGFDAAEAAREIEARFSPKLDVKPVNFFQGTALTAETYSLHWPYRLHTWGLRRLICA